MDLELTVKEAQDRLAQYIDELAKEANAEIRKDFAAAEKEHFERFEQVKKDFNLGMTEEDYEMEKFLIEEK
jgi:cytochrome c